MLSYLLNVTPFVGVWIETSQRSYGYAPRYVTPFVGVWIETADIKFTAKTYGVTPFVGVWIETQIAQQVYKNDLSHPSWVCGLKRINNKLQDSIFESHPSWVCGLKHRKLAHVYKINAVTPFVGVWIETLCNVDYLTPSSVTPFVGVWIETCFA